MTQKDETIAVIGLGYVGLPLAVLFSRYYPVIGYDQSKKRVAELNQFQDITNEVAPGALREVLELVGESNGKNGLTITDSSALIANCDVYIVAVPTPVDDKFLPDLSLLRQASHLIASVLKKGDLEHL